MKKNKLAQKMNKKALKKRARLTFNKRVTNIKKTLMAIDRAESKREARRAQRIADAERQNEANDLEDMTIDTPTIDENTANV